MWNYLTTSLWSGSLMILVSTASYLISVVILVVLFLVIGQMNAWNARSRLSLAQSLFGGFAFSMLGSSVGFITSLSREASVGAVLPAILGLVGGLGVFLVSKGGRSAISAAVAVVCLCVSFSAGIAYGAKARVESEQVATSFEAQRAVANQELNLKLYRQAIGLDPKQPPVSTAGTSPAPQPQR